MEEEKKSSGISIVVYLIALSIILDFGLIYYNYQLNKMVRKQILEISNLNFSITELQNQNRRYQWQVLSALEIENEYEDSSEIIKEVSPLVKGVLQKHLKLYAYQNSSIGPMPGLLVELGLSTEKMINEEMEGVNDSSTYIKSHVKYDDFKYELLQYYSEEYISENYSQYKDMDGFVGFCNCAGGAIPYSVYDIEYISNDGNKYTYNITFRDDEIYELIKNGEEAESNYIFNQKIEFKKVDDNIIICSKDRVL